MISVASAAVVTFDDRGAFEAAATGPLVSESLESAATGLLNVPVVFDGSMLGFDVSGGDSVDAFITDNTIFSTPSDGVQHLRTGFGFGAYEGVFNTPSDALAFGFDLSGYQDFDGSGTIELILVANGFAIETISFAAPPVVGGGFLGFTSDIAFDEIRVQIDGGAAGSIADIVGFDAMTYALVPVPAVWACGLMAVAGLGRRRRQS